MKEKIKIMSTRVRLKGEVVREVLVRLILGGLAGAMLAGFVIMFFLEE